MFTAIYLVYLIATLTECIHQTFANLMQDGNFQLDSNEVFVIAFPLLPYKKQLHSSNQLHVTFSQSDYADLPTWIKYTTINETVLLYGKSPTAEPLSLAMILHESYLMETLVESISLNFAGQPANNNTIMNEVHLRLSNTNLFDFHSRKQELISVFRDHLWTGDPSVKYTLIARPQDVSARLPLNPNDKEG